MNTAVLYQPTPLEQVHAMYLAQNIFIIAPNMPMHISGRSAVPFLTQSGVDRRLLRSIWSAADPNNIGTLTETSQFHLMLRLVAMAQAGMLSVEQDPSSMRMAAEQQASVQLMLPQFSSVVLPSHDHLYSMYGAYLTTPPPAMGFGAPQGSFGVQSANSFGATSQVSTTSITDAFGDLGPVENAPLPSLGEMPPATDPAASVSSGMAPDAGVQAPAAVSDDEFGDFESTTPAPMEATSIESTPMAATGGNDPAPISSNQSFAEQSAASAVSVSDAFGELGGGSNAPLSSLDQVGAPQAQESIENEFGGFEDAAAVTNQPTTIPAADSGLGSFVSAPSQDGGSVATGGMSVSDAFGDMAGGAQEAPPRLPPSAQPQVETVDPDDSEFDAAGFGDFGSAAPGPTPEAAGSAPTISDSFGGMEIPDAPLPPLDQLGNNLGGPGVNEADQSATIGGNADGMPQPQVGGMQDDADFGGFQDTPSAQDDLGITQQPSTDSRMSATSQISGTESMGVGSQAGLNDPGQFQTAQQMPPASSSDDPFSAFDAIAPPVPAPSMMSTPMTSNDGSLGMATADAGMEQSVASAAPTLTRTLPPADATIPSLDGSPPLGGEPQMESATLPAASDDPFGAFDAIAPPDAQLPGLGPPQASLPPEGSVDGAFQSGADQGGLTATNTFESGNGEAFVDAASPGLVDNQVAGAGAGDMLGGFGAQPTLSMGSDFGGFENAGNAQGDGLVGLSVQPSAEDNVFGDFAAPTQAATSSIDASMGLTQEPGQGSQMANSGEPDLFGAPVSAPVGAGFDAFASAAPQGTTAPAAGDLFGASPAAPPIPVSSGGDDDFGDFGAAPNTPAPADDDFGDFGAAPVAPPAPTPSGGDGDGDFGVFGSAPPAPVLADDDFGDFGAAPLPTPAPSSGDFGLFDSAPPAPAQVEDDFGDFGTAPVTPPGPVQNAGDGDFGLFGNAPPAPAPVDDDFGDFGAAPVAPPAPVSSGGDGDFGIFDGATPAPAPVNDDFGDFGNAPVAPPAPRQSGGDGDFGVFDNAPPAPAPVDDEFGDFNAPAAPPAAADGSAEDDFGMFDNAPPATVAPIDEDFGDFSAPAATQATEPSGGEGDFGLLDNAPAPADDDFGNFGIAPPQPTTGGGDDFGAFDNAPSKSAPADDYFGDFGNAPVSPPIAAPSGEGDDFGAFDNAASTSAPVDGDFGDFGNAPAAPLADAASREDDDFGAFDKAPAASMLADDDFGNFDNAAAAPPVPAPSGGDDDFGAFDNAASVPADDDFGNFDTAPVATSAPAPSGGDDFGDFDNPPSAAPADDDFGNFDNAPAPATSGGDDDFGNFDNAPPSSAPADDDFDDFGDFDNAPAIAPAPAPSGGDDDFGNFGKAPESVPSDDDFGGFGDFSGFEGGPEASASPSSGPPAGSAAAGNIQTQIRALSTRLPEAFLRKKDSGEHVDLGECLEVNLGLDVPFDPQRQKRVDRCLQLLEVLSKDDSKLGSAYWQQSLGVVRNELLLGKSIILEAKKLAPAEFSKVKKPLAAMIAGLVEFMRVTRSIVATVGDILLLDPSALLTIDTWASTWCSLSILENALEVEKIWRELLTEANEKLKPDMKALDEIDLSNIRRNLCGRTSPEKLCHLTLQPLAKKSAKTTRSKVSWNGVHFMACSANFLAHKCPFYVASR